MQSEDINMEEVLDLPERMFDAGHELVGLWVTAYGPINGITAILDTLDPEERTDMAKSCFGKFIGLTEKPNFSGRFARFMLSRMLKVNKKHEIWFLFVGKPVRFSLRQFALVTGLPCGKFPHKSKKRMKNNITDTPYWPTLFGSLETITVDAVLKMLKRKTVADTETRKKFAYLALLASVVLPTTHTHKIIKEHANLMKNMSEVFAYPWGRLAFEMIINSIKERNEVTLSQNTIAIKGFVFAMQLVMVEVVPALIECPLAIDPSESESEGENGVATEEKHVYLSPSHARRLNDNPTVGVQSIITGDGEVEIDEEDIYWSDEDEDPKVSKMVTLISVEYDFHAEMFTKGVTKGDVKRMIEEGKVKNVNKDRYGRLKQTKPFLILDDGGRCACQGSGSGSVKDVDIEAIATLVAAKLMVDVKMLRASVVEVNSKLDAILAPSSSITAALSNDVCKVVGDLKSQVVEAINGWLEKETHITATHTVVLDNANTAQPVSKSGQPIVPDVQVGGEKEDMVLDGAPKDADKTNKANNNSAAEDGNNMGNNTNEVDATDPASPSFSLGLTQELRDEVIEDPILGDDPEQEGTCLVLRQSKRTKRLPKTYVKDFHCDKPLVLKTRDAFFLSIGVGKLEDNGKRFTKLKKKLKDSTSVSIAGISIPSTDFIDIGGRKKGLPNKVVDLLIYQISQMLGNSNAQLKKNTAVFDSRFVGLLGKYSGKINKAGGLVGPGFPKELVQCFNEGYNKDVVLHQFYFPFNFDQIHWIGICVDCVCSTILLLDCDLEIRTDDAIKKEINPLAQLVPYLLKQVGRESSGKDTKPFAIERPRTIPQNGKHFDSAVTTTLLIQAHAIGGLEMSGITPSMLEMEAKGLVVLMYEAENGQLV